MWNYGIFSHLFVYFGVYMYFGFLQAITPWCGCCSCPQSDRIIGYFHRSHCFASCQWVGAYTIMIWDTLMVVYEFEHLYISFADEYAILRSEKCWLKEYTWVLNNINILRCSFLCVYVVLLVGHNTLEYIHRKLSDTSC